MIEVYRFHSPEQSDYESIAKNGLAYTRESSGFHDWLKKGVPDPQDPYAVFAELRSVDVVPVLWATASWNCVAFLVTEETLRLFRRNHLTGFDVAPVRIVKVATKGKRRKVVNSGEPEDQILARRNVIDEVGDLPVLWGIRVTGIAEVTPDAGQWDNRSRLVQAYSFSRDPDSDLFYSSQNGQRYSNHLFCGRRLKDVLTDKGVRNIAFTPFEEWKEREFYSEEAQRSRAMFEEELRALRGPGQ
jgi:hypothetical protein